MTFASQSEPIWKRRLFALVALTFTAGLWLFLSSFQAPGPGRFGIDENAYLVGGKLFAQHGSPGFRPGDDYQFVGAMWVRTSSGWYYPKYPFGTSLLHAATVLLGRRELAFAISPACTALAALGMFFLSRQIIGSFYGLLAMIALSMGPTTLQLSILPNSHAPALCFVVWGMFFLLQWWQSGRWWIGLLAGLLLGYAVTIRYTEALLLFPLYPFRVVRADQFIGPKLIAILKIVCFLPIGPLGIAAISRAKWKSLKSYVSAAVPLVAWAAPVGALLIFNKLTLGHFTGYDSTNESSGFSVNNLVEKWDFAVNQLYVLGLFVFAPLGIAGLVQMYRGNWRAALLMTMWFVPGTLLYTAYYWGRDLPDIAFLRFFLTLFPPAIIAALYLLCATEVSGKGSIASALAAGLLTASAAAVGLHGSLDELVRQHRGNLNMHYSAREIISHVKPSRAGRPMILADSGMFPQMLQYMQFMLDADWYPSDTFSPRVGGGFGLFGVMEKRAPADDSPVVLQRDRMDYIDSVRKGKTAADFVRDAQHLMVQSLNSGRGVYVVVSPGQSSSFRDRYIGNRLEMIEVDRWAEPCNVPFPAAGQHNWLAPTVPPDNDILPWRRQWWEMFEIRKAPTTLQTTSSASR